MLNFTYILIHSVDYGLRIDYCAANYSYGTKCYHIVFSRSETLEVNYLSVSARSDARSGAFVWRKAARNAFSLFTSSVQFKPCRPYDYSFILSPLSGNTIKLRYAVAQCQDEDTQEINYVCSFSARNTPLRSVRSTKFNFPFALIFLVAAIVPIIQDVFPILLLLIRTIFFAYLQQISPDQSFYFM